MHQKIYCDWDKVPVLMDVGMACILLGLSDKMVRQMLRTGQLPGVKLGREWRIPKEGVMRLTGCA